MSYLVFCTFDLKNATSRDYETAYADLQKIGLNKIHAVDGGGKVIIPTTSVMGTFNGTGAANIRNDIRDRVTAAFTARRFKSEIFVTVGGENWGWGAAAT